MNDTCFLCQSLIKKHPYWDGPRSFCCAGCQAVYQILAAQQAVDNFQNHPVFQQALRSGLISNPDFLQQLQQPPLDLPDEEFKKLYLEIQEMWCPSCAEVIRLILLKEKGIKHCVVDYATDLACIEYTPRYLSEDKILRLIKQLGYHPVFLEDSNQKAVSHSLYFRFIVATFFSLNIMMFAYPIYASYFEEEVWGYTSLFAWISLWSSLPVLIYSAWPIWRRFFSGLRVGIWGMEALVLIGVLAAFGFSTYELLHDRYDVYFDSMTVIIVFVLLGKIIEAKAKFSAKDTLIQLTRALPRKGRKRLPDGTEQFIPLKDFNLGDDLIVLLGEKIALDGVVEEGEGTCDESLMTGESLPVFKQKNSMVLAGSILQQGRLVAKVTAKPESTALQRIIEMVEQDIGYKSHYVRAADKIMRWFVPLVMMLAFLTLTYCLILNVADPGYTVIQTAIMRAVSVLLISCPCAIGIAAPLAESHVLNALAKRGALIRNRGCLSFLGKETTFIFDKTGTITEGKFTVIEGLKSLSFTESRLLKGLVSQSNHPIAVALNRALLVPAQTFQYIEEIVGKGMRGVYNKKNYYIGSAAFLGQQGISIPYSIQNSSTSTCVFFACENHCLTQIILGDRLRMEAKCLIQGLKQQCRTWLVSGDHPATVEAIAKECGFDQWRAGCHPLQKRELVDQLRKKGEIVAMLGDGINDAPALTAAHIGIAVVSATDLSVHVSDILLTTDRLQVLDSLHQMAVKGHRIIKQNLFWAFFYNLMGIVLAMAGILSPLFAAFAMVISSLIVLFNAQRIR